jgi:hypothetical protein
MQAILDALRAVDAVQKTGLSAERWHDSARSANTVDALGDG